MTSNGDEVATNEADRSETEENPGFCNCGNARCALQQSSCSVDHGNSRCAVNEDSISKGTDDATIRKNEQEQPKTRRMTRRRNLGHPDRAPPPPSAHHRNLETGKKPVSKPRRRRRPSRAKYRTTAVQAAFKSLERPREEQKKAMSQIYPPLFADETEFNVDSDDDFEAFGSGRVMMWDPVRKRKVAGAASPLRKNLDDYLRKKRFMQVFYGQDSLLKRDHRHARENSGWTDSRNEVILDQDDEVPMCKIVRRA